MPWFRVNPEVPHTHRFQVWLSYDADVLADVAVRLAEETRVTLFHRWFPAPKRPPGLSVTEVAVAAEGLEWTERISTPVAFTWCSSLPTPPGINSCRVAEQPESHLCPERRRTLHWPTCCVHGFSRESGG
uniref:Uncharacterized protein n=1 Tax=Streptomyces avermitilis TaxID=33903 RepID=A0A499V245_STRAX|nr:hypothetical protein SAVMC3_09630 [Streptomyces avermitilis]